MLLQQTLGWFQRALPQPGTKNQHTQLGVHFEEVAEMIQEISSQEVDTIYLLVEAQEALKKLATHLKSKDKVIFIKPEQRVDFLDSLCDQLVTATGCAHNFQLDILGGLNEVNNSNWSKFVDGQPIFDANRKIQKGPGYFKPDLSKFVPAT